MKHFLFRILIFVLLSSPVFATEHRIWKHIGPVGGGIGEVVPDRNHSQSWFSKVNQTLYHSSNGARSWKKITENIGSFALNPKDSSLYIISGNNGIVSKSIDNGHTFVEVGNSPLVTNLELDPTVSGLMYVADQSIFRSENEGRTWDKLSISFTTDRGLFGCSEKEFYIHDLLVSPIQTGSLYASVELAKCPIVDREQISASLILESIDRGNSWTIVVARRTKPYLFKWDAGYPGRAYAYNGRQIEVLTAAGWSVLSKLPCSSPFCSSTQLVEIIGSPGNFIVEHRLSTQNAEKIRFLYSDDNGRTWIEQTSPFWWFLRTLHSMQTPKGGLLAGTNYGGLYIRNSMGKWHPANMGFEQKMHLHHVVASGNYIYAYGEDYGGIHFYLSSDRGKSWINLFGKIPAGSILNAAVNPNDGKHVVIALTPDDPYSGGRTLNFYVTRDAGQHWKLALAKRRKNSRPTIYFHPVYSDVVFLSTRNELYRSEAFGLNPTPIQLRDIKEISDLKADKVSPETIYLTNEVRVYKSTNRALTFASTGSIPIEDDGDGAVYLCQVGRERGTFLVDNHNMGVLLTTNGGDRWRNWSRVPARMGGGGDPPGAGPIISADNEGKQFFSYSHGDIFESSNGGLSWKNLKREFPLETRSSLSVNDMTDPTIGPFIVATNYGLFKAMTVASNRKDKLISDSTRRHQVTRKE